MTDTLSNILLPESQWVDVYAAASIPAGRSILIENVGVADVYYTEIDSAPPADYDAYKIVKRNCCIEVDSSDFPSGIWAKCPNQDGKINVEENIDQVSAGVVASFSPFNDISVSEKEAVVSLVGSNGVFPELVNSVISGGDAFAGSNSDGQFVATSSTGPGLSFAAIFSFIAAAYRAGQGFVAAFSAVFDDNTGETGSSLRAGPLNATDALQIVRRDGIDEIWYQHHGQQEIQALTYSTGAAGIENVTVEIGGTSYPVTLSGTDTSTALAASETADQLTGVVPNWLFQAVGAEVICRSLLATPIIGAFSFTPAGGGTAAAAFTQIAVGAVPTLVTYPRSAWTNRLAVPWLDLTKENVYRVCGQYLGVIFFEVQNPKTGRFVTMHLIEYPNSNTRPMFAQPSFRIGWTSVHENSNATQFSVKGGEASVHVPGGLRALTPPHNESNTIAVLDDTNFTNLITIKNSETFKQKVNLAILNALDFLGFTGAANGAEVLVISDATFDTPLKYVYHDEENSVALLSFDPAVWDGTSGEIQRRIRVSGSYGADAPAELKGLIDWVLPGENISVVMRREKGASATQGGGTIAWEEII